MSNQPPRQEGTVNDEGSTTQDVDISTLPPDDSLQRARAAGFQGALDSYYALEAERNAPPAPEPTPEPTLADDPSAFGLDEGRANLAAIADAEEAARVRARQWNIVELAKQELVQRGEVKSVDELASMPPEDVLTLAGFQKSQAHAQLEADLALMNDPAKMRERALEDERNRLISAWNFAGPNREARARELGLDPDAIQQHKIDEANRRRF
jgi:hypothetical protein